jgi:YHS domain-containing protein
MEDSEPSVIDPICHMTLTPSTARFDQMYDGVKHYFCGKGCLKEFRNLHKGAA